ncbi:MAG TPA: bifunctional diguanylate cyclase/phosphodiesterase [Candidatus Limnocylindrales bacterium]|nr:bifunctional diguanylate cyclase/phosphodiesterase [Candidatus Limnocylindrales bacterium]
MADMPAAALRLIAAMAALAVVAAVGMPLLTGETTMTLRGFGHFAIVVGLVVLARLFRMPMRVGTASIGVAWGEAAVIVGFTLVPAGWVPAAVLIGTFAGTAVRSTFSDGRRAIEWLRISSALTLSSCLAVALVARSGVNPTRLMLVPALVLASAAVIYLLSTLLLLAIYLSVRDGSPIVPVVWGALRNTPIMIVGNLALGLLAALLWQTEDYFILVLPPLLWLMHQLYSHRLREDEERRTWRAFALASRSLHRLDEVAVAHEGVRSARALFPVQRVELTVFGSGTRYTLDSVSSNVEASDAAEEPELVAGPGLAVTRGLEVAGGPVGTLTLIPTRAGSWGTNDQHRLAAFGDALAAALHDAATHSALKDLHERTSYESSHDPLTRLLNRDALLDRGHALLRSCPPGQPVALVLLDLDNFKAVNDTLGHLAGDELLQRTAARLADDADTGELVARLGGDEFALLMTTLPEPVDPANDSNPLQGATAVALRRARALSVSLAAPIEVAGVMLSVDVTAGVVVATAGPVDLIELLRRADIALYQAKGSGVRTQAYLPVRDDTSTDRLAIVAELQAALAEQDQLTVVMLPTVDLPTGLPIGVEALIRWHHPRRGLLIPKDFVRAAEASDLLGQFTRYVLDKALAAAAELAKAGLKLPVSVNLSPRSLLDPQLPGDLAELLARHEVPAEHLVLEITETVVLSPLRITDQVLHSLRALGVRFAVDDFGTGYSSLTFLTRIAVDELKVDRTFVARMAESKEAAAIVRAIIDLGQRLGIRVVAEGVETQEQRHALVRLGCDAGQGFHFSRPVESSDVVEALRRLRSTARTVRVVRGGPEATPAAAAGE